MSEDYSYIESLSGESGDLSKASGLCGELNGSFTKLLDSILGGPDNTDAFDASCNTCKHFVRASMTKEQKAERNIYGMPGHCAIKNIATIGWQRGQYCGFENANCYENRRSGLRPHEAKIIPSLGGS